MGFESISTADWDAGVCSVILIASQLVFDIRFQFRQLSNLGEVEETTYRLYSIHEKSFLSQRQNSIFDCLINNVLAAKQLLAQKKERIFSRSSNSA